MIVVTGATGRIGNVLVRKLVQRGETVRAVVRRWTTTGCLAGLEVEMVEGNVTDLDTLVRAFEGCDIVYHLAATIDLGGGNGKLLEQANVVGTRNVVQACLQTGVRRLVYASSIQALAQTPHGIVVDETRPFDPEKTLGDYGRSKARATLEVLSAVQQGLDAVILCPTGVTGPYDYTPSEMGSMVVMALNGSLKVAMEGASDYVDVRDVVDGLIAAAEKGRKGESYILSGERATVADFMALVAEAAGVEPPSFTIPLSLLRLMAAVTPLYYRLSRTKPLFTPYSVQILGSNCVITSAKARRELGYSPRPLKETVADTVEWFRNNGSV